MSTRNRLLLDECRRSVNDHTSFQAPLNAQLLQQVAGAGANERDYLYGGFGTSAGIRAALHAIGTSLYDCRRVLDFGCGSARIIRWFRDVAANGSLYGCDINGPAVDWCKAQIDFADFSINQPWPPLPYSSGMFDVVYGISVLTHLDEAMQKAWLGELYRITKPGGIVLLTVHGEDKARSDVSPEELSQFTAKGFLYRAATVSATVDGLPSFYQVAFHSERYIRAVWSKWFDVLGYVRHGCMYAQDLVILRTNSSTKIESGNCHALGTVDLPLAAFEQPAIGTNVHEQRGVRDFKVTGWAFRPDGEPPLLELSIDGERVAECLATESRPNVLSAFPTHAAAAESGFSVALDCSRLKEGLHIMWATTKNSELPLWVTYFRSSKPLWRRLLSSWTQS